MRALCMASCEVGAVACMRCIGPGINLTSGWTMTTEIIVGPSALNALKLYHSRNQSKRLTIK